MADNFGNAYIGRAYEGASFYAVPTVAVPANAVFCPAPTTSGQFGIAEYPVEAGALGAFATRGTFAFDRPEGWSSVAGQRVYYTPTTAVEGTFSTTSASGAIPFGFEVVRPGEPTGQIFIDVTYGNDMIK
jgi:hypothetical protein